MRKPNPKIRWHLSDAENKQIAALSGEGLNQTAIARILRLNRNTIHLALKKMGLPTRPRLLHQEEILALLRKGGMEQRQIARTLNVSQRAVAAFARQHGFGRPRKALSGKRMTWLLDDISNRRGSAQSLARKYGTSYRKVLKLAHSTLKCERFLPIAKPPLSSYFPQKHFSKAEKSAIHV